MKRPLWILFDSEVIMENERDIAIKINNLKKRYRLGVIGGGTLQGDIQSWWARVRGKEDPNLRIGKKTYGKNETFMALDGIDLTVYKGERLGIIGHNGAGKSTLLKLLSRVTAPTEGEIYLDGRISSMLEVGTGFNGELTGRENIYLNGAILGMTTAEVDSKIDQIIEFSECSKFIDTPVKRYSSGMYVKLAFAVAAHLDSEILVMDEVLAVGDMKFQQKCLGKMSEVSESEGRTVLYVSHNMNTIRQLCDRCIVLEHGKVVFNGAVEEAISIYMNSHFSTDNVVNDISNQRMSYLTGLPKVKLQQSVLIGKDTTYYDNDKYIDFSVSWKTIEKPENLYIRLELHNIDDTPVATALSEKLPESNPGEIIFKDFRLDISKLVSGRYKAVLLLYSKNDYNVCTDLDAVYPALNFELLRSFEDKQAVKWNSRSWGRIRLNDLKII